MVSLLVRQLQRVRRFRITQLLSLRITTFNKQAVTRRDTLFCIEGGKLAKSFFAPKRRQKAFFRRSSFSERLFCHFQQQVKAKVFISRSKLLDCFFSHFALFARFLNFLEGAVGEQYSGGN